MHNETFYTNKNIAKKCVETLHTFLTVDSNDVYLEPTAGDGAFLDFLPNYEAYDLKPEDPRISQQDIFTFVPKRTDYVTIGNPPFGKRSKLAIDVFNTVAKYSNVIAFIVPVSFMKYNVQKELDKEMERRIMGGDIDEMFADLDSSFDDIDFGDAFDDEDEDNLTINNNNVVHTDAGDNANVYATLMVTDSINKQTQTHVETSKATVDTMVTIASNQMMMTKQIGSDILGELGAINENLTALIEYNNENMTRFIEASIKYPR